MLSYDEVVTLLTVCDCGNFTRAAQALYIGQPALSKKVRAIEEKLGYQIFIRNKGRKSIELSDKANQLIPILHQIKQLNSDASEIRYSSDKNVVKIASSDGPYLLAIDCAVEKLVLKRPNTVFKLKNMSYKECFDALENDIIDIAFVGNNIYRKYIHSYPLYEEKMVFVCPADHNYGSIVDINALNVADSIYSAYSTEFSSWFKAVFKNERPLLQCDLIFQVERYIEKLDLWSIVPYSVAKYLSEKIEISVLPLTIEPPMRLIYYAVKSEQFSDSIKELLTEVLKQLPVDLNTKIY